MVDPRVRLRRVQSAADHIALVVARADGEVITQNDLAVKLMGPGIGQACWEVVGALQNAEGLPCTRGCVGQLVESGLGRSRRAQFAVKGQRFDLTCIALDGRAICLLSPRLLARRWERLTPREQEVLRLLADGETTSSLATRLELSESTVRTHVEHMREKLGVHTRTALVARGFRLGFLD
ncbi:MAG: LuxR C-terminal-related transcriptional regulator [Myxococcota bacterium]